MREKRTKAAKAKAAKRKAPVRCRRTTVAPKGAQRVASAVSAPPAPKPRRHTAHNVFVLVAAVLTLAILAGVSAVPRLLNSLNPPPAQFDEAAFVREIDRALAEGPAIVSDLPRFVVAPVQTSNSEAEPLRRMAGRADAIDAIREQHSLAHVSANRARSTAAPEHPRQRSASERRRQRTSTSNDPHGLEAMAKASSNDLIAEARKYLGGNPTGWADAWCGKFLDMVLKRTGHRGGGNLARGYIKYGTRLAGPEIGAIAVFSRPGGGHVGIVTGIDSNGNPIIISGNHNDRVAIAPYPASRALAYVRP